MSDAPYGSAKPVPESLLRVLALLAGSNAAPPPTDVIGDTDDFVAQPGSLSRSDLFTDNLSDAKGGRPASASLTLGPHVNALIAKDALHDHERILRMGWLWFSGTVIENGEEVQYLFPAVSVPVRFGYSVRSLGEPFVEAVGDIEVTPLIADPNIRELLAADVKMGGGALASNLMDGSRPDSRLLDRLPELRGWSTMVSDAVGIDVEQHVIFGRGPVGPLHRRKLPGIVAFYGFALYADRSAIAFDHSDALGQLAKLRNLDGTVFTRLYWPQSQRPPRPSGERRPGNKVRPLSRRQLDVLESVRSTPPITAVTGAPGNGKSHVLTSIAIDAIADGKSVLVVAGSPFAVDVLVEHFQRTPGAIPVAFGGSLHGRRLADELLELGNRQARTSPDIGGHSEFEQLWRTSTDLVGCESEAARFSTDSVARLQATDELERAGDLDELIELVEDSSGDGVRGMLGRRHRNEVARRLGLVSFDPDAARSALARLRRVDQARRLALVDGLELESSLARLAATESFEFDNNGRTIADERLANRPVNSAHVIGQVAMALRSDRVRRRQILGRIPPALLAHAVPLWIGVARDVADVLPEAAGMFDVVIMDEAAQLDQIAAAHALVRAKTLVACGDSNQLGFFSTLSDRQVAAAAEQEQLDLLFDPRQQSVLDLASAAGPTLQLTEHFRSAPHLIEFSSRRFYGSLVDVVTRRPDNEASDHIEVEHVAGGNRPTGIGSANDLEVAAAMRLLRDAIARGWRSIGILSPFPAQATALENAIIETYRPEEIIKYGIRAGTVHGFQGDERDLMLLSWAIGADEGLEPWTYVNRPPLFNVMVTRARHQVVVVTSVGNPPGLAGEYLAWSKPLENLIDDVGSADPWVNAVAEACRDAGVATRVGYLVGPHAVDLVIGEGANSIAVDCVPHREGSTAHLDRAMMLRRTGWRTTDGYQSRWHGRTGELAVSLARMLEESERP